FPGFRVMCDERPFASVSSSPNTRLAKYTRGRGESEHARQSRAFGQQSITAVRPFWPGSGSRSQRNDLLSYLKTHWENAYQPAARMKRSEIRDRRSRIPLRSMQVTESLQIFSTRP